MIEQIEETLRRYNVVYDTWSSERALHESGAVERALSELREAGHVYESEGATWLRTTEFGDDKDRVLIRSDGDSTYFLSDIAYHRDKLERGADRLINVLGADHHGYPPRLRAALAALGYDPEVLETPIMQLVHVVEGGERAQMSKRSGEFVTLDELIDDIGADAARFFMLQRSHDTTVDLDLELARKTSNENPVYYVQYAHARIASILRKAGEEAVERAASRRLRRLRGAGRALRAGADQAALRAARRGRRGGGAPRAAPALRLRDGGGRATSTPSTATARWSARRARGSRRRGSGSACSPSGRSRARSGCSGSPRPSGCEPGLELVPAQVGLEPRCIPRIERLRLRRVRSRSSGAAFAAARRRSRLPPAGSPTPGTSQASRSKPWPLGVARTRGPYSATSASLIWSLSLPSAIRLRIRARSRSAWGESDSASSVPQIVHITSSSTSGRDARGCLGGGRDAGAGQQQGDRGRDGGRPDHVGMPISGAICCAR